MFGLFKKTGFDAEMLELDNENRALGAQLVNSMQMFDLSGQMRIIDNQLALYERRINCCKKYGKFDLMRKLEGERERLKELRG